ncbi:ead/Ea22-like family protein [Enterobacter hormaechei]
MINIDKRALREAAEKALSAGDGNWQTWREAGMNYPEIFTSSGHIVATVNGSFAVVRSDFIAAANPATVLALLDELEAMHKYAKDRDAENEGLMLTVGRLRVERDAAEKRIAELSHHLQCAHGFIQHTEAFGHEASNGILCCGDAQWNIDESKSVLAAAGKGE